GRIVFQAGPSCRRIIGFERRAHSGRRLSISVLLLWIIRAIRMSVEVCSTKVSAIAPIIKIIHRHGSLCSMNARFSLAIIIVLLCLVLVPLAALQYTFSQAAQYYAQLNQVRLDPLGVNQPFAAPAPLLPDQKRVVYYGDSRAEQWPPPDTMA